MVRVKTIKLLLRDLVTLQLLEQILVQVEIFALQHSYPDANSVRRVLLVRKAHGLTQFRHELIKFNVASKLAQERAVRGIFSAIFSHRHLIDWLRTVENVLQNANLLNLFESWLCDLLLLYHYRLLHISNFNNLRAVFRAVLHIGNILDLGLFDNTIGV